MSQKSDEQLVAAFQRGDAQAFEEFVARHQDRVYRLARLWLADPQFAADALQETLLRSYTGFGRFRFRAAPATWLLRTARNVCREFNRQRRMEPLDEQADGMLDSSSPGDRRDANAQLQRLHSAIAALPERQRQVIGLRVLEEQSIATTAVVMGCRPGTVKAHLHKALENLRKVEGLELIDE